MRACWARSACRRSSRASTTQAARSRRSCWQSSGVRPRGVSPRRRWPCVGRSCSAWFKRSRRSSPDQGARAPDRDRRARPSRRRDLPIAVQGPQQLHDRGPAAGRDRRLPRALPDPRRARRRRRPGRGRDRVRQTQSRVLSLGVQQAPALLVLHAGRHHPPLAPLGARPLRRRPRPWPRPPPRATHRRPCLVSHRLACWQERTPYDPTRHRAIQRQSLSPFPPRRAPRPISPPPSGWPAPLSPKRRPAGPSAQRLTASRHPLSHSELDTGRLLRVVPVLEQHSRCRALQSPTLMLVRDCGTVGGPDLRYPGRSFLGESHRAPRVQRRDPVVAIAVVSSRRANEARAVVRWHFTGGLLETATRGSRSAEAKRLRDQRRHDLRDRHARS